MSQYFQLDRRFCDYDTERSREWDDWTPMFGSTWAAPYTWDKVLSHRATIIVAEGGAGKTRELKETAERLRKDGQAAFFTPIENLIDLPFTSAIEIGTKAEFAAWSASGAPGWFFLDSVDEAKIASPKRFETAIANFIDAIDRHLDRARVVISTRPQAWDLLDQDMFCRRLNLRKPGERNAACEVDEGDGRESAAAAGETGQIVRVPAEVQHPLKVLQLAPLNLDQIRRFAAGNGVENPEQFVAWVQNANADVFANRPSDLPGLINLYRRGEAIGSYERVVDANIDLKITELNRSYIKATKLTPERALQGAEALAAAVTFTKKTYLRLPGDDGLNADDAIDPAQVLPTWTSAEVEELLGRSLFDQSNYGAVKFHHTTARAFLTARWLSNLLHRKRHRRSVKRLLFARPYGTERPVVVPSMKVVVGWLSLWDADIRDSAIAIDPKVLLEFGDAASLPSEIRLKLLRDFAARYALQQRTPLHLDHREVSRLARPDMSTNIRELLVAYAGHTDVRQLLLRIIEQGRLLGASDVALDLATNIDMDDYTRAFAAEAVGVTGTATECGALRTNIVDHAAATARLVLASCIGVLYPRHLSNADVLQILAQLKAQDDETRTDSLKYRLIDVVRAIGSQDERLSLLRGLATLLEQQPHFSEYCRISKAYFWLLEPATALAMRVVEGGQAGPFDSAVLSVLLMATEADHLRNYTGDIRKDVLTLIGSNAELRRALVWHDADFGSAKEPPEEITDWLKLRHAFSNGCAFGSEDEQYYKDAVLTRLRPADRSLALSIVLQLLRGKSDSDRQEALTRLEELVAHEPILVAQLQRYSAPPSPELVKMEAKVRAQAENSKKRERAAATKRAEGIQWLRENHQTLQIGDFGPNGQTHQNINYLLHEARPKSDTSRWTTTTWRRLEPEFGTQVAHALRDHCVAFWRRYTPQLRSEIGIDSHSIPHAVVVGLSGLGIDALETEHWAKTLTANDAALATRYALLEMNGYPAWFEELAQAHPKIVGEILEGEVRWEYALPSAEHRVSYVLSRLGWSSTPLSDLMRGRVATMVTKNPRAHIAALTDALSLILRSSDPLPEEFETIVDGQSRDDPDEARKALWIAADMSLNPGRAVTKLIDWVSLAADAIAAERRVSAVLVHMWGGRHNGLGAVQRGAWTAPLLTALLKVAHTHVSLETDLHHTSVYSPGIRDNAQEARDYALKRLQELPGRETYDALRDLSQFHRIANVKEWHLVLAERRAETDSEGSPWQARELPAFVQTADRDPGTQLDLHGLVLDRLDDLKANLEEGDMSEARTVQRAVEETELRNYLANRLTQAADGKYTTGSEEEMANAKRTDIRFHNPAVEARVPIEVKIAEKWSGADLRERLQNQLVGQYMREATCGTFLLIRRGNRTLGDKNHWEKPDTGQRVGFEDLVTWLQDEAEKIARAVPRVQQLSVVGIDLTRRNLPAANWLYETAGLTMDWLKRKVSVKKAE